MILLLVIALHVRIKLGIIDPQTPSVYNLDRGGVSSFYFTMSRMQGVAVRIIKSVDEIDSYPPLHTALILASPDYPLSAEDAKEITSWVERGGLLVLLDETSSTRSLMERLGIRQQDLVREVTTAFCRLSNKSSLPIVVNYYTPLDAEQGVPLCFADGRVVAYSLIIGRGTAYVLGDSSVIINEHMGSPYREFIVKMFAEVLDNRTYVLFYEGGRRYLFVPGIERLPILILLAPFIGLRVLSSFVVQSDVGTRMLFLALTSMFVLLYLVTKLYQR